MRGWLITVSAAALAGCGGPAQLEVEDAWVRLPAAPGRPAAAYFTLEGGDAPRRLIRVTADYAVRSEMHETLSRNGTSSGHGGGHMSMRPIAGVDVPAHGEVAFEPGGKHVMLYDLDPRAKPGVTTLLTLTFSDGRRVYRKARIVGPAADDPD